MDTRIIITITKFVGLGIAFIVIGAGIGYWGYGYLHTNPAPSVQQNDTEQNTLTDGDENSDTTLEDSSITDYSTFDEEVNFIKGDIEWLIPTERESLNIVSPQSKEETITYTTVGKIKKSGIFQGDELVLLQTDYGMDSETYYVIAHQGTNYIITSLSSDPIYGTLNTQNTGIAPGITLEELRFPETIYGPKPRQTLKRYYPFWSKVYLFNSKDKTMAFTHPDYGTVYENTARGFSFKAPDGTEIYYALEPDFVSEDLIPQVIWNDGSRNQDQYTFTDIGGCGNTNVLSVMTSSDIDITQGLVKAGVNTQGDTVWELKDSQDALLRKIYDEQYIVYEEGKQKISYDEFIKRHPAFFWKDPFNRMVKFQKQEFLPAAECAKPVIYLYPKTTTDVSVEIDPQGGFLYTEPEYGDGWQVTAQPDGRLIDIQSGKEYPYLFWEGRGGYYETPKKGFVVERAGVEKLLREKLAIIGLNSREINDFVEYWVPEMQVKPYYFITFMGNQTMDVLAPLSVNPQPDTIIRVLMDFVPLDQPIEVEPLGLRTISRKGFTVIEWGGVRHGERQ